MMPHGEREAWLGERGFGDSSHHGGIALSLSMSETAKRPNATRRLGYAGARTWAPARRQPSARVRDAQNAA